MRTDDSDSPFRVHWDLVLHKYFKDVPTGYTKFYFFEFARGYLTYRRLANSPDTEAKTVRLIEMKPGIKEQLMVELFGKTDLHNLRMEDLNLPKNPGKLLSDTKVKSLALKYFSIPECYLKYYPKCEIKLDTEDKSKKTLLSSVKRKLGSKVSKSSSKLGAKKRRVGRPKKTPPIPVGVQSITRFFRSE